jgi:hypothetical protein
MKRLILVLLILLPAGLMALTPPIPTIVAVTNHGTFTYPTPIAGASGIGDFQITISFVGTPSPTNPFYFYQEIDNSLWSALQALSISSAFSSLFAAGPTSYTGYSAKSVTVTSTTGFYTGNYFTYDYTAYMPLPPGTYNTYIWMADSSLTPVATYVLPIIIWTPTPVSTATPVPIPSFIPTPPVSNGLLKGYLVTTVYGSLHVWTGDKEFISWDFLYGESLITPIPGVTIVPLY